MRDVQKQLQAFWDLRFGVPEYVYGTEPNQFLMQQAHHLARGGRVLCLADGEGRNGVWLARQGFKVQSVDISAQGIEKTQMLARQCGVELDTLVADVTTLDMGSTQWDGIVSIFLHLPAKARAELHRRVVRALKPGGVFVWEAYAPTQLALKTGGPRDAALLPGLDEVAIDFDSSTLQHAWTGLRPVQEGSLHTGIGAVTQLLVKKAAQPGA